jgi:hypothetical protein
MVNTNMAQSILHENSGAWKQAWAASFKQQAASHKRQATSCDNLSLDIMINPIYSYTRAARELVSIRSGISHAKRASREKQAAAPNNRRTYERQKDQTGIPSWWREAGRGKGKRRQISTGTHPGDAAGTPSLPHIGPEVHRDRISRHSKSSFQRSFSRLCLELNMLAPSRGLATSHLYQAASRKRPSFKHQAS